MEIYKITNLLNGKIYIGQTIYTGKRRFNQHAQVKNTIISRAIQKYGKDNFIVNTVEECNSTTELDDREAYWIAAFDCLKPKGYNLREGGQQSRWSDAAKADLRQKWADRKEPHPTAKVKEHEALEMIRRYEQGEGAYQIAKDFGFSRATVDSICKGNGWHYLPRDPNYVRDTGQHQLVESEAIDIIARFAAGQDSFEISEAYPLQSRGTITQIIYGRSWAYLPRPYDCYEKARSNMHVTLTEKEVLEIIERYKQGERPRDIHKDYPHVRYSCVNQIRSGRTWKHLTGGEIAKPKDLVDFGNMKLDNEQVASIIERFSKGESVKSVRDSSYPDLTLACLYNIRSGKTWLHIERPDLRPEPKITEEDVIEMIRLFQEGWAVTKINELYPQICKQTIRDIRNNENGLWAHVPRPDSYPKPIKYIKSVASAPASPPLSPPLSCSAYASLPQVLHSLGTSLITTP